MIKGLMVCLLGAAMLLTAQSADASSQVWKHSDVTLYGWPDNDPPGNAIAYPRSDGWPTLHDVAISGSGTYANPITFATDSREIRPGTRIYVRYLNKYFIMEDDCVECDSDWSHGWYHVDLWIGGQGYKTSYVLNREDEHTNPWQWIIINPPSNWWVNPKPLLSY